MTTYYARNVTGNWASNTSWDLVSSGGAGPAGPPVAGDTAIFDSGFTGTITIAAAAACATLTCQAGATGTLTWGAYTLTTTADVTFVSGFNISGSSGNLSISGGTLATGGITGGPQLICTGTGGKTINSNGTTWPVLKTSSGAQTITLTSALQVTTLQTTTNYSPTTFAGAYDITCDKYYGPSYIEGITNTFKAGTTLTVNTHLYLYTPPNPAGSVSTVKSDTASSDFYLHYNGTAENCRVFGVAFTDVNCAHNITNWCGGTLTRTTGIYNANITHYPTVGNVNTGVTYGGIDDASVAQYTGTLSGGSGGGLPILGGSVVR